MERRPPRRVRLRSVNEVASSPILLPYSYSLKDMLTLADELLELKHPARTAFLESGDQSAPMHKPPHRREFPPHPRRQSRRLASHSYARAPQSRSCRCPASETTTSSTCRRTRTGLSSRRAARHVHTRRQARRRGLLQPRVRRRARKSHRQSRRRSRRSQNLSRSHRRCRSQSRRQSRSRRRCRRHR